MERIQSALAKARAAREGTSSPRAPVSGRSRTPPVVEEAWTELPLVEPDPGHLSSKRITTLRGGPEAVEFDRLRTRMLQRMQANNWKSVAIVSSSSQSGKSTVTANLALSFARQSFLTAVVLELDLHRPSLAELLGIRAARFDLARVLTGEARFAEHAVRLRDNLIVAPAQPRRSGAAELLQAPETAATLAEIDSLYKPSITLFDTPPLEVSDDTIGVLANADCALIVAAAGITTIEQIDQCEREVAERTDVLGVVLNKCRYEHESEDYVY